jgi:hypothetical protein
VSLHEAGVRGESAGVPRGSADPDLPAAATSEATGRSRRGPDVPAAVWALSAVAAGIAVVLALTVFRHGSIDNDDGVYLLQARALLHGRLTVPMPANAEASQPWFFAITSHGYVSKYLPLVAALYAVGLGLFGSVVPLLAVLAFLLPLCVWALAREVGLPRRRAILATALVGLSPAVLVQGGLVLSYLPFLILLTIGWLLLLRVARSGSLVCAALFGLVFSVAVSFRQLDPVLLLGPAAVWVAWRLRWRPLVRPLLGAVVGALPVAVLVLAYDAHVTGSALRLPFGLLSPNDKPGFGVRQLVPEDPRRHFGVLQGLYGALEHFLHEPLGWVIGFVLVVPLAFWNLRRTGAANTPVRVLSTSAAVFVLVYLGFWGPWNASVLWGGPRDVGPFYALPILVPLAFAAVSWWPTDRRRVLAMGLLGAVALGFTTSLLVGLIPRLARDNGTTRALLGAVHDARPGPVLLGVDPPYLSHPVGALGDQWPGTGRHLLLASQLDADQVTGLANPSLLQIAGDAYGGDLSYTLVPESRMSGTALRLSVVLVGGAQDETLVVSRGGALSACRLYQGAILTVTATSVTGCSGLPLPHVAGRTAGHDILDRLPYRLCSSSNCLSFSTFETDKKGKPYATGWRRLPLAIDGRTVTLLADGAPVVSSGSGYVTVTPTVG